MKKRNKVVVTLGLLILITAIFFLISSSITKHTGYSITQIDSKSDFEKCLEEQDITLYINTADSTKTLQKINLIDYLRFSKIINCNSNNQKCIQNKINKFPTWIINNQKIEKDISLNELIINSGCKFTE